MSNDVINAVKRLDRAGAENSRITEKLRDAVMTVAANIEARMPMNLHTLTLPRGYRLTRDVGAVDLESPEIVDNEYTPYRVRLNRAYDEISRNVALQFSEDIASGLLDEIAERIEKLTAAEQAALESIESTL